MWRRSRPGRGRLSLVKPNQLIFLDASSTHLLLASLMPEFQNLTVVTNSPAICHAGRPGIRTILIGGGRIRWSAGPVETSRRPRASKVPLRPRFPGVCAWSSDLGFSAVHLPGQRVQRRVAGDYCRDDQAGVWLTTLPARCGSRLLICTQRDRSWSGTFRRAAPSSPPADRAGCAVTESGRPGLEAAR